MAQLVVFILSVFSIYSDTALDEKDEKGKDPKTIINL